MSRRLAEDIKRIVGLDDKSRPLEKRDPLPRVLGGLGVSIIEGESEPLVPEPVDYEPYVYGLFRNGTARVFRPEDDYGIPTTTALVNGNDAEFNYWAISADIEVKCRLNTQSWEFDFSVDGNVIFSTEADGGMVCASETHAYFVYILSNTLYIRGYLLSDNNLDYTYSYSFASKNNVDFLESVAYRDGKISVGYFLGIPISGGDENDPDVGNWLSVVDLTSETFTAHKIPNNGRSVNASAYDDKFCVVVHVGDGSGGVNSELWLFDDNASNKQVVSGPSHTNIWISGAAYTGKRIVAIHNAWFIGSAGSPVSVYDLETETWTLAHTMPNNVRGGMMTVNANTQWEMDNPIEW